MSTVLSPLPAFRFQCTLPTVSASTSSSSSGSGAQQGPDVVALLVERFTPPMGSLDSEAVPFQSGSRNFPVGAVSDTMGQTAGAVGDTVSGAAGAASGTLRQTAAAIGQLEQAARGLDALGQRLNQLEVRFNT